MTVRHIYISRGVARTVTMSTTLRRFSMSHFDPSSIILEGITGSTAYGLATPDSDVDKHGIYQASTHEVLGLFPPKETVVTNDPDITYHEVAKCSVSQ